MKHRYIAGNAGTLLLLAVALAGCQPDHGAGVPADPATTAGQPPLVDLHTSRGSLDWPGRYEGLLACADCAGIHVQLTLAADGRFSLVTRRLVRGSEPLATEGQFDWEPDGNTIVVATVDGTRRFAVGEGRLLLLEPGQVQPAWGRANATLARSSPDWDDRPLGEMLEAHGWLLTHAIDAANQPIDALFPDAAESFSFEFAEARVRAQGGCNGLRGSFLLDARDQLEIVGAMSSLMACAEPLMVADRALSALLAAPLETVLVRGQQPTLALLAADGDALLLTGELTPEARFGAATMLFLEVDAQLVDCMDSPRSDGLCLNVRERIFDEQSLLEPASADWQPLPADIQGFRHEAGIRSVLRVKRFDAAAGPGAPPAAVYVLDLTVQSEVVPR